MLKLLYDIIPLQLDSNAILSVKKHYEVLSVLGKNDLLLINMLKQNLLYNLFCFGLQKSFSISDVNWLTILAKFQNEMDLNKFAVMISVYLNVINNCIIFFLNEILFAKDIRFFVQTLYSFFHDFFVFITSVQNLCLGNVVNTKSFVFSLKCKSTDINVYPMYHDVFRFYHTFSFGLDYQDMLQYIEIYVVL